ncbi:Mu transposase C-terminal domain-containing protein [Siccirubricoccus sp. G192]|uniref:Mu transposase C-terminal domain-containing protein n=1 Tax=Siccirubricoccus sp. G192 TaxID=2849651 RepID=UPI001C2C5E5E|nr:Mu transposase C-terminal domain-containing protein [Siccirubricoccus sp. G192]MBV1800328.1 DDE-type integrase/transposase/recombinase [Siccirubricoccus sp. G192]MBV1800551.1 DDE-type integrase/transposase/recombinase [Siccirubricoccus sp. G192]
MSKVRLPKRPAPAHAIPDAAWAEAARREAVVRPLAAERWLGRAAVERAARSLGLSPTRIYGLVRAFRRHPVTAVLALSKLGPARGSRRLAPAMDARIEAAIDAVYLRAERPTLARLLGQVAYACRAERLAPPSMKALRARITARSLRERMAAREGAAAAGGRFRQVKAGPRTERPLQVVQIDHTLVDIQLVDDAMRACIGRPWLTLALDVHTRLVLGLYIALDPPSAAGVGLTVAQAVLPKPSWLDDHGVALTWPAEGRPEVILVDNGREFHSRAFERGCRQHGIEIDYRPPAAPRFGGHIEPLMGTLMRRIHALPGATFSDPVECGDYASEARAVLTLREFEHILALEVLGPYHNEVHSALGRTPMSAWLEGTHGLDLRPPADAGALLLDFLPFEERLVRRDGVRLFNVLYQDGALAHLVDRGGARVRVKYDPRDLSAVFVELPTGDHVRVPYADLGRPPVTLWEHPRPAGGCGRKGGAPWMSTRSSRRSPSSAGSLPRRTA